MGGSKIEWTDRAWDPVTGCTKVSQGCENCYAERMAERLAGRVGYPADEPFRVTLHPERLAAPLCWMKPQRVFVNSMSDLFHKDVPDEFIDDVFAVMAQCQQHTFQVLTKRPARVLEWAMSLRTRRPRPGFGVCTGGPPFCMGKFCPNHEPDVGLCESDWPLPNVWLGVSVEDQATADERIPLLLQTPAAVRFVSCEPLLGPVDLRNIEHERMVRIDALTGQHGWPHPHADGATRLDWVICGGESGPGARPMHPDWARSLRDQCQSAGVPFFFKQWGEWVYNDFGTELLPERIGKRAAGRLLDGREHNEFPDTGRRA